MKRNKYWKTAPSGSSYRSGLGIGPAPTLGTLVKVIRNPNESVGKTSLCGSLCDLRASVVNVCRSNFTTETQSITEFAQRDFFFRQTPKASC